MSIIGFFYHTDKWTVVRSDSEDFSYTSYGHGFIPIMFKRLKKRK